MDSLSSTSRTRCVSPSDSLAMGGLARADGQRQSEGRAATGAGALGLERSAELLGRERRAVQAEAMALAACREAVVEDAVEVLPHDAHAGIDYRDLHRAADGADPHGDALRAAAGLVAGVLGITDHVHQDLQHPVLVHLDQRHFAEITHDGYAMAAEGPLVHAQAVLGEHAH